MTPPPSYGRFLPDDVDPRDAEGADGFCDRLAELWSGQPQIFVAELNRFRRWARAVGLDDSTIAALEREAVWRGQR